MMDLSRARAMLPEIRETAGLAASDFAETYDTEHGRVEICMRDPLTGRVEPISTILPECGFAERRLLGRAPVYVGALLALLDEALQVIRRLQPPKPETTKPQPRDFARDAGILCNDPTFRGYMAACHDADTSDAERTATRLRTILRIKSRAELNTDPAALDRWQKLLENFRRWKERR